MQTNFDSMNNNLNKSHIKNLTKDINIDIFSESMTQYLQKLNAAADGRYELDDYDMQVIAIAMDQYANWLRKAS